MFALYGCAEDIRVTAVLQFQTLAESIGREWKVAHSNVGVSDALERVAQFLLIHCADGLDAILLAREVCYLVVGEEYVRVRVSLCYAETRYEEVPAASFHDGGVGEEEKPPSNSILTFP